ncbi:MAG: ATP-binding protein [Geminicoccaceae bacterium]
MATVREQIPFLTSPSLGWAILATAEALILFACAGPLALTDRMIAAEIGLAGPFLPGWAIMLPALLARGRLGWQAKLVLVLATDLLIRDHGSVSEALLIGGADCLLALGAWWLIRQTIRPEKTNLGPADVMWLVFIVAGITANLGGLATATITGTESVGSWAKSWQSVWITGAAIALLTTPLVLAYRPEARAGLRGRLKLNELIVVTAVTAALTGVIFSAQLFALVVVVQGLLLWSALRLGALVASATMFMIACVALMLARDGLGPFASAGALDLPALIELGLFVGATAVTVLFVAVSAERLKESRAKAKDAERRLAAYARELERSNQDLRNFASLASHDMKEPLRAISRYGALLDDVYAERLDEEGRAFLAYMVEGSQRMQRLIEEILGYATIGQSKGDPEPVDLNVTIGHVLTDVAALVPETGRIEVATLPVIPGHASDLERLFRNLIVNAVKYRAERPLEIIIDAARRGARCEIRISDNGIGIAPEQRAEVFEMFRRLHPRSRYDGSGIGLAACTKIVDRMDGQIWIEDGLEGGACFVVELPCGLDATEAGQLT